MALTNAERQAKHRAKHVKLSAESVNTLHVVLIRQRDKAIEANDWFGVATTHAAEADLYEAVGNDASARTCKRQALRAWISLYEAQGDTEAAECGRAILARGDARDARCSGVCERARRAQWRAVNRIGLV